MADDQIIGINYFPHQFLRAADFTAAQDYHVARLGQHNLLLHTLGIVKGLDVAVSGPSPSKTVAIFQGCAVDMAGREIVLRATAAPEIPALVKVEGDQDKEEHLTGTTPLSVDLSLVPVPPSGTPDPVYLTIRQAPKPTTPSTDPGIAGDTRFAERPLIEATTAPVSGAQLILAKINRAPLTGAIATIDLSARLKAGAVIADGAVTNTKIANGAVTQNKVASSAISLQQLKRTPVVTGTSVINAVGSPTGNSISLPPAPPSAGLYLLDVGFFVQPTAAATISWQEELAFSPGPPATTIRRWRISNLNNFQVTVTYTISGIETT